MPMHKDEIKKVVAILGRVYADSCDILKKGSDPFQTVISTALSAQSTDDQVDRVTPLLFRRYPTPEKLARAKISDVEKVIKSVGLYKSKARNIVGAARVIVERFGGEVPSNLDALTLLPGVGRKTANVVLIKSFGRAAMPVDTHVFRVANRIGIGPGKTPEEVEKKLISAIPEKKLAEAHFWLITHDREICHARNPECGRCPVSKLCDYNIRGLHAGSKIRRPAVQSGRTE
ncbi:MAG TPA: endonuclease III [bacterium]|nr:endonuclease III [bacterium]